MTPLYPHTPTHSCDTRSQNVTSAKAEKKKKMAQDLHSVPESSHTQLSEPDNQEARGRVWVATNHRQQTGSEGGGIVALGG